MRFVCSAGHLRATRTHGGCCSELVWGGVGGKPCGREVTLISDSASTVVALAVRAHQEEHGSLGVHVLILDVLRDLGWPGAGSWRA